MTTDELARRVIDRLCAGQMYYRRCLGCGMVYHGSDTSACGCTDLKEPVFHLLPAGDLTAAIKEAMDDES